MNGNLLGAKRRLDPPLNTRQFSPLWKHPRSGSAPDFALLLGAADASMADMVGRVPVRVVVAASALLAWATLCAGCEGPYASNDPESRANRTSPIPNPGNPVMIEAPHAALFDAAERTLRNRRFTIYRADAELGEIVTDPLTGQQMWEFWRSDAVGAYNQFESSMHTILRTIEIRVYPVRDSRGAVLPDKNYLEVRAYTDRLSEPERAFTAANQLPTNYDPTRGLVNALQLEEEQTTKTHRVFLSRDNLLEDSLIRDVLSQTYHAPLPAAGATSAPDRR